MPLINFANIIAAINRKKQTALRWFISLVIIQSFYSIYSIIQIPVDPKNVTLLGLTRGRLMLIALILGLDLLGTFIFFSNKCLKIFLKSLSGSTKNQRGLQTTALILMLIFWISLWLPKYRMGELYEEYERMRPFLLWLGAIGVELFFLLRIFSFDKPKVDQDKNFVFFKKPFLFSLFITMFFALLYFYLQKNVSFSSGIIEPASAPVTALQLFLLWLMVILINQVCLKKALLSKTVFILITAALIYALSCIVFLSISLPCKGDMVGIYPPNYVCYPDIYDAVYNVGSLYTYYGEGIYNQWFTDKPVYMLFLTFCQWIAGNQIQEYMTVQVLILSLLPVSIFLITRNLASYTSALLAALISVVTQYNSMLLYSKLGGVNVRIAATEIFTALLLTCSAYVIYKWFNNPDKLIWPLTTGAALGLTILTRFNTVLIVPLLGLTVIGFYQKNKRSTLRTLASFGAGLAIVLSPWFLLNPIINPDLSNPYLEKIQNIFIERAADQAGQKVLEKALPVTLVSDTQFVNPEADQLINTNTREFAQEDITANNQTHGFFNRVVLHSINNLMSTFFSLPVNSVFHDSKIITDQPFWYRDNQPIWQRAISFENLVLWCLSIFLFIWGVWHCWRHRGLGGLAPLIIFLGYLLGNSFALTSGGRYLIPVIWIVFLYFSVGLVNISKTVIEKLGFPANEEVTLGEENKLTENPKLSAFRTCLNKPGIQSAAIVLLIMPAILLPFLQLIIPDQLPPERTTQTEQLFYDQLDINFSAAAWDAFLAEEDSIIMEGILFFPQYFDQSRYSRAFGTNVFEALVFGKDYVYLSYMWHQRPDYITDGSKVLIAGCMQEEGPMWGMERRIVHAYAVIQLDNEKGIYLDSEVEWTCQ